MKAITDKIRSGENGCRMAQPLDTSYRSERNIVEVANEVFVPAFASQLAEEEVRLKCSTENSTEGNLHLWLAQGSKEDSATKVAKRIAEMVRDGIFPKDIAVLARSRNDFKALATTVQSKNCMLFKAVSSISDVTGLGFDIKNLGLTHTRILYSSIPAQAGTPALQDLASAYASLLLATNYRGSSTAKTMHLKTLSGVEADDSITDTTLATLTSCGVDSYLYVAGLPKVWTTSANTYSDEILNLIWFANSIEVAGFNCLSQTGTKLPQTEYGMSILKLAYDNVCQQAINNGVAGAGVWTISQTFGDPSIFKSCIASYGYYIYSAPISSQSVSDRENRKAPLVQIAIKLTGAIHSTDVMVLVNR